MISSKEEIPKNSHLNIVIMKDSLNLRMIIDVKKDIVSRRNFFMLYSLMYVSAYEITTVVIVITMIKKFFEVSSIVKLNCSLVNIMSPISIIFIFNTILSIKFSFIIVKITHIVNNFIIVFFINITFLILLSQSNVFIKL